MKKSQTRFDLTFFSSLPSIPAVYFIWGESDTLLYIGKAKNLKRRLLQYKNAKRYRRHKKMRELIRLAHKITWRPFESHLEACVFEVESIQKHRPPYNIMAKFSFLYPMIGVRSEGNSFELIYTTHPERFKGVKFFGAFRSRRFSVEAFFSLASLLKILLIPKSRTGKEIVEHSYVFQFQRAENHFLKELEVFFMGIDSGFLESLALSLLEKRGARQRSKEVAENLKTLRKFYNWEVKQLAQLIKSAAFTEYPVPQEMRDILYVRSQLGVLAE